MSAKLTAETAAAMAALAGNRLDEGVPARVAAAIGPALATFSAVEGTIAFEAEPSGFILAQRAEAGE